jgi:hypothetical protein
MCARLESGRLCEKLPATGCRVGPGDLQEPVAVMDHLAILNGVIYEGTPVSQIITVLSRACASESDGES